MAISADLGETLERFVEELVANGRYGSKSEVLREGVRLVQEREAALRKLWHELDRGIADIEGGRAVDADDAFDRLEAKYLRLERERAATAGRK